MNEDGKEKVDDRFGDLFTDKAFQIDEESERYNQLKPVCMYTFQFDVEMLRIYRTCFARISFDII